ncbi:MAG: pilus assembly protein TadG-related protein [Ilumatobacteraceae bacterium]
MRAKGRDRGQAVALLLMVVVMAALAVVGTGEFSVHIIDRGRAQTAADAAALAAIDGGRVEARRLAADNGARLVSYLERDGAITVVVDVGGQQATARATDGP